MYQTTAFGQPVIIKRILILILGIITYFRHRWVMQTRVEGANVLNGLPMKQVMFVSNHQTYFADVLVLYYILSSVNWRFRKRDRINWPIWLIWPKHNIYYVAAEETMNAGILPKIFSLAGAIKVKRTWREGGKDVKRPVNLKEYSEIVGALKDGWVITFPQGTTTPFMPGRKGSAHIIKTSQCTVVPVVIDGFRRAFDKKGLLIKKPGVKLSVRFKEPLDIDYNSTPEEIMELVMDAIEQSEKYNTMKHLKETEGPSKYS